MSLGRLLFSEGKQSEGVDLGREESREGIKVGGGEGGETTFGKNKK